MTGNEIAGLVMSAAGLLGGGLAFLSRRNDVEAEKRHVAESGRVTDNIAALSRRVDEYHAEIVKRMDKADERSSNFASMVQSVPVLQAKVAALEEWRREVAR